jgi:hypothetical protein
VYREPCCLGCAGIFASKRNEAKLMRNFFRFEAKQKVSFASCRFEAKRKKAKRNGHEISQGSETMRNKISPISEIEQSETKN